MTEMISTSVHSSLLRQGRRAPRTDQDQSSATSNPSFEVIVVQHTDQPRSTSHDDLCRRRRRRTNFFPESEIDDFAPESFAHFVEQLRMRNRWGHSDCDEVISVAVKDLDLDKWNVEVRCPLRCRCLLVRI